jgi:MoxR-like ATPase
MVDVSETIREIQQKYGIIGRSEELRKMILARDSAKNILIEGDVGVGKTTIAKALASHYDSNFFRIDCSEETLPHNLIGFFDPPLAISNGYIEDSYIYGPLTKAMQKGGCLFINEINRMPENTQNSLLTSLDERIIDIPKLGVIKANDGFFAIATQNPAAHIGVTVLGEALKDRFIWIKLDYQNPDEEVLIIKKEANLNDSEGENIAKIAQKIVQLSRQNSSLRRGSSIRGAIDLADIISRTGNSKSTKEWIETSIMSLHNKIELEDGVTRTKSEVISEIVLAVLNKMDFQ